MKKLKNKYYLLRHGECTSNIKRISSYSWEKEDPLTENGKNQAKIISKRLEEYKIDLIYCSPFRRTKETLAAINENLGIKEKKIFFDKRLEENNFGITDKKNYDEFHKLFNSQEEYFQIPVPEGENYLDVNKRILEFINEVEKKYQNKKILIISHGVPLRIFELTAKGLNNKKIIEELKKKNSQKREEIICI